MTTVKSAIKVSGYAAAGLGQRLEPFDYFAGDLNENEVRVSVSHCGVCHTDIQAIEDYYGITTFPFTPGHEIIGHVTEVGPGVQDIKPGERVGIGWQARSCGECEWCRKGETQLCMDIVNTCVCVPHGGFSTSVTADHRFVYPIPEAMSSSDAAVLMCAGATVFSAFQINRIDAGQKIAVVGVGGLGHLAIQFARAFGCEVSAISSTASKEEESVRFGASQFLNSNDRAAMRKASYEFDTLVVTSNDGLHWEMLLEILKKRGKIILLGFPDIVMNSTDLVAHELSITGSLVTNPARMLEMLAFAQEHQIKPMVELMPMSQVNEALLKVKQNQARYRIVLVNENA